MNKKELVSAVAEKTGTTEAVTKKVIDAALEAVIETVVVGDKVQLAGLGTLSAKDRAERQGRNPRTGENITIPATRIPSFQPAKAFKEAVAK